MYSKTLLFVLLITILVVLPGMADSIEGLPLHMKKIGPDVVRVWVGDHVSSTAVTAIGTKKGIVVIDSTNIPKLDQAFRKIIARELGRNDFKYLINTHGHADHTSGNGVYADCQIIAHENVKGMMEETIRDIPQRIKWNTESLQEQKNKIASGKLKQEEKAAANEQLIISTLIGEYLKSSPKPTFPTKTFRDTFILDCGDTTLELYQAGGTHTKSDIFILVPQKGLLFTGDMMADKWLSDTPGCLATFAIHSGQVDDYPVLVKNWQALIERKNEIKQYITGHWNGELTFDGFKDRFEYLKTMLIDIEAMAKTENDFNEFATSYSLKNKFSNLVNSPGLSDRGHTMSIGHLYQIYSGKISVPDALQEMIGNNTFDTKFDTLKNDILSARKKYFYTENQINGLGYFLLQQQKQIENAFKLFELNKELYPESWNAYDSLAEGYYHKGEKQKALELYRKSLELNPSNENGKKFIQQIEKELNK